MSRTGATVTRVLLALLLLLPVVAGAVYTVAAGTDLISAQAAGAGDDPATVGAVARGTRDGADLVAARRAAGEADTQAGFLVTGTGELHDGAAELADGSRRLSEGATEAANGSQQLTDGLIKLQAGTGQLGDGATRVADGVSRAVEQIEAMPGTRDELLKVLDDVDATLAKSDHPEAPQLRMDLVKLRVEVVNFRIAPEMISQLHELRDGSREVANQLSTPGQPFRDGIYSAVTGSRSLTSGLRELNEGTQTLRSGADELRDGAERIRVMAEANENKVEAIQAGLPARGAAGAAQIPAGETAPGSDTGTGPGLMNALFIAFLVWLAATSLWLIARPSPAPTGARSEGSSRSVAESGLAVAGIAVIGAVFAATVIRSPGSIALTGAILVVALTAITASVLGRAVIALFGGAVGRAVLAVGLAAQAGILGHVLSDASVGETPTAFWRLATALTPVAYPTGALAALDSGTHGSGTHGPVLWVAVAVLGALAILGTVISRFAPDTGANPEQAPGSDTDGEPVTSIGPRPAGEPTATTPAVR
ncbi:hypothetical protein M0E87_02155 [Corynebacterium sp. CCM 9185]|uniref:YhgE/Pip domain-containing protein n=1 Tax=Corynebacterium marambiense TaxID=2765364 RepID=A0ABS0VS83_9CORY|nr:hypothetical protein [Corynebacterium marambiense]MBI8999635.1 hypothetical protein [Corynebacterium marambiense]MCK7662473.1 hypothetical protein [Corynebacterium marambiense]MCX7541761.1 hypothetical protein [Corynebacterium marambiense]